MSERIHVGTMGAGGQVLVRSASGEISIREFDHDTMEADEATGQVYMKKGIFHNVTVTYSRTHTDTEQSMIDALAESEAAARGGYDVQDN